MALHRLTSVTMGVPNVGETAAYYQEFGLSPAEDGWFATRDAGRQLRIVHAPTRRLVDLRVGVDDADDLDRAADSLHRLGIEVRRGRGFISATEKATGTVAYLEIADRFEQEAVAAARYNGPGRYERAGRRAPGVVSTDQVRPRKLGHAVLGSTDFEGTQAFFTAGLGFKVSDYIKGVGAFMRCSTDHHNVLVLAAPVSFLHHTSLLYGSDYCWTPAAGVAAQLASVDSASSNSASSDRPSSDRASSDSSGGTDWRALTAANTAKLLPRFGG
jgi:catechol 2,3-dioxygenase-like lactoylglutathione lyase family enzyme